MTQNLVRYQFENSLSKLVDCTLTQMDYTMPVAQVWPACETYNFNGIQKVMICFGGNNRACQT